jgi:chromosome segregation ATPase
LLQGLLGVVGGYEVFINIKHYFHIMLTMRAINPDGTWAAKSRNINGMKVLTVDWNNRANPEIWRKDWARICNEYLEINDHADRIDHRSHKRRGLDELPSVHLGVAAHQMEQRGIRTERGNRNREIADFNKELRQLKARIVKLQNWLDEDSKSPKHPMLYDTIQDVLHRKAKSGKSQHYQDIANVKAFANMLNFLQKNKITDVSDLNAQVKSMYQKQSVIRDELKPVERRLKVLAKHIKQSENFNKYKSVYEQYQSIEPGLADKLFKREPKTDFYEKHRAEITLFEVADRYLKEHLNGKVSKPPMKKWRVAYAELSKKRDTIYRGYYSLKDEVKEVERVRQTVDEVMRGEVVRDRQKKREECGLE